MSTLHSSPHDSSRHDSSRHDDDARPRVGTIIWGAVAVVIGALVLLGELTRLAFDPALVFMVLLVGAGAALIIGGILSMNRRK